MKCPRCSSEIPAGIEVCARCGFIIADDSAQNNNAYQNMGYNNQNQGFDAPVNQNFDNQNQGFNNPVNQNYQNLGFNDPVNQNPGFNNPVNQNYNGPVNNGYNAPVQNNQIKQPKKKNRTVAIVVGAVAFLICFVIAFGMSGGSSSGGSYSSDSTTTTKETTTKAPNSEYTHIFSDRNIVEPIDLFFGLESAAFATVDEETGMVEKLAFGYDGDTVKEMHDIIYLLVEDYTDSQKQELEDKLREEYAEIEAHECCTIVYTQGGNYLTVNITFTDIDKKENIEALEQYGVINGTGADVISMEKTREGLLADGYVEK